MSETELTIIPPPQIHLGSLPIRNPTDLVAKATEMANSLAQIITTQNLYKVINGRKYVVVEGWTTLGAMMGIVPIEEFCRPLPVDSEGLVTGFEAKVKLIRAGDGGIVGAASSECTYDEANWKDRDSYALRSMSITRATGKAYRLSFSWIMKLAGFEATPAEEMDGIKDAKKATPAPQTAKPAETVESAKEPPNVYLEPGKQGFCTITGDGLAVILSKLYETEKTLLGLAYDGNFWTVPIANAFRFADACVKHGVGVVHMDSGAARTSAPNGGGAQPSPASPSPIIKATYPKSGTTKSTKEKPAREWACLEVIYDDKKYLCWDKTLWPYLEDAGRKKLTALLQTTKSFDGKKSPTIEGILRIGDTEFEVIEGRSVPVIQRGSSSA